jgi:N-acetylmuramoyl-L-alanine amidase
MVRHFFLALASVVFLASSAPAAAQSLIPQRSTAPVVVIWPNENSSIPAGSDGMFILGSVSNATAPFTINGRTVTPHSNGAFLSWHPVEPGTFSFRLSLTLPEGVTDFYRMINVPAVPPPSEEPVALEPKADLFLKPGDLFAARVRGLSGKEAHVRIGSGPWRPMREGQPGSYEGSVPLTIGELEAKGSEVVYKLGKGWGSEKVKAMGKIFPYEPQVAVVRSTTPIRGGLGNGFMLFPLPGTKVMVDGRAGDQARLRLSPAHEGWVGLRDLEFLPGAAAPRAVTGVMSTAASYDATVVRLGLTERVPFTIEASPDRRSVLVRLFYTTGHTNWIVYDDADDYVREIRWKQESAGVVTASVFLAEGTELWGWNGTYEGSALRVELRHPPKPTLKGLKVMLDPGHMPSATGATGPRGLQEMAANYAIAQEIEALLKKEGAVPMMTRSGPEDEVSLTDRPKLALEQRADLFISVHNNALPDGENPFSKPRGFSVFYYHPQSLALARHVYASFVKRVPLPAESLRWGDLLVPRFPAVPSILIENAYMILPEHEAKLDDPKFRRTLAAAVVEGLRSYMLQRKPKP